MEGERCCYLYGADSQKLRQKIERSTPFHIGFYNCLMHILSNLIYYEIRKRKYFHENTQVFLQLIISRFIAVTWFLHEFQSVVVPTIYNSHNECYHADDTQQLDPSSNPKRSQQLDLSSNPKRKWGQCWLTR